MEQAVFQSDSRLLGRMNYVCAGILVSSSLPFVEIRKVSLRSEDQSFSVIVEGESYKDPGNQCFKGDRLEELNGEEMVTISPMVSVAEEELEGANSGGFGGENQPEEALVRRDPGREDGDKCLVRKETQIVPERVATSEVPLGNIFKLPREERAVCWVNGEQNRCCVCMGDNVRLKAVVTGEAWLLWRQLYDFEVQRGGLTLPAFYTSIEGNIIMLLYYVRWFLMSTI